MDEDGDTRLDAILKRCTVLNREIKELNDAQPVEVWNSNPEEIVQFTRDLRQEAEAAFEKDRKLRIIPQLLSMRVLVSKQTSNGLVMFETQLINARYWTIGRSCGILTRASGFTLTHPVVPTRSSRLLRKCS
jgi:hypothetical protein